MIANNQFHVFAFLFTSFITPFMATINVVATNFADAVQLPAMLLATLYLCLKGYQALLSGESGNPILDLVRACVRISIVLSCLSVAVYTGEIAGLLLNTLPTELSQAITGNAAVGAGSFDNLAAETVLSSLQNIKNLPTAFLSIVYGAFDVVYACASLLAIAVAFGLWLITQVYIGLLVAIGPLAIACVMLPYTSRYFHGWVSAIATSIVQQILIVTTVTILVATINTVLGPVLNANAATGANANDPVTQMTNLLEALVTFIILIYISYGTNRLAAIIGGGAAAEINAASQWAMGHIGTAASAAHGAATGGSSSAPAGLTKGGAAGMRSITPVGKAIG